MKKVTLNKDLVPFLRTPSKKPHIAASQDLTQNYLLACKLIRAANVLFQMRKGFAIYSGYVYESNDKPFRIRLVHRGKIVRTVALSRLGYAGTLQVSISIRRLEGAMYLDVLGSLIEKTSEKSEVTLEVS
jgi:hypothetical protein